MQLFFNSSMPRSGSELLQVILHQNPKIYASTTSPLLEYQYGARSNYMLPEVQSQDPATMHKAFISMCRGMAESYYSALTNRPIVVDKNRGWSHYWEWVHQWWPNPKMICMVRDLRSILASMEKIYRANRHTPVGPDNPVEIRNMTVAQRLTYWLNSQPVGLALQRTADLIERKIAEKILFIRYEDLCNNPVSVMQAVYAYLGLPYFQHDFNRLEKAILEVDRMFTPYGSHIVLPQLRPVRPRDWEDVLCKVTGVDKVAEWYFDFFKYEV